MADGSQLGAPVGIGDKIATDDLGATGKVQWVKLMDGTDNGTATIPGDATNGLRVDVNQASVADGGALPAKGVQVGGTDGTLFQVLSTDAAGRLNTNINGTVPVSAASLPLPTGASTAAKQPALGTAGTASADVITVQGVASMTAVKVDGSAVTQPVSGPLTDAQLRATAVPVSGTVTASGPLTDAQLRATAVPVSGTVTANLAASASATGLSKSHLVSAATTNPTNVKASAGKLHGWYIYNSNASARKVAFHNTAGAPTAGTAVTDSIVIPPASAANAFTDTGIAFSTGIAFTTVTGLADADATAVAANDLVINLYYV